MNANLLSTIGGLIRIRIPEWFYINVSLMNKVAGNQNFHFSEDSFVFEQHH